MSRCGRCRAEGHNRATCKEPVRAWERTAEAQRKREHVERANWRAMLERCGLGRGPGDERYVGRGITVCERWLDFDAFFSDMGPMPSRRHSLDRYPDNNGNYEPGNCRWATAVEQGRNKRTNVKVGQHNTIAEMAEARGTSGALAGYHLRTRNKRKRSFICRNCGMPGHNRRTCRAGVIPFVRGEFSEAS